MNPQVDTSRVMSELQKLATFSSHSAPAVTRVVFSDEDLRARQYLRTLYESAGLDVRVDAIGNTFARWPGSEPQASAVATGSHTDAIPNAGMYDGTVGVLGGLEAIRALKSAGFQPRRSIEVIMFTSEEPTRFAIGCSGSRAMAGSLTAPDFQRLTDADGQTYDHVRQAAGFSGALTTLALPRDAYHAFVELHIEQGPRLERAAIPIGIVTAIAAPATLDVIIEGEGGHAGGVMMADRKDAFTAAAEIALKLEELARTASSDTVATCGLIKIEPGAVNSIPYRASLTLDIRDIDGNRRDRLITTFQREADTIALQRDVRISFNLRNADPPATCDPMVVSAVRQACIATQKQSMDLVSRAYHDSLFMARVALMGMIFIPCRRGVSHRPDEYASPEHITCGIEVLTHTLATLSK